MAKHSITDPGKTSFLLLGTNPVYTLLPALTLGLDVQRQSYEDLLAGKRVPFKNRTVHVMFFFPYPFWDSKCEIEGSDVVYGVDRSVYDRFRRYWGRVERALRGTYTDKKLDFVIDPKLVFVDRDKILTHDMLAKAGVPVTETIADRSVEGVLAHVTAGRGVFVKSRYGAEGKGITRLRKNSWKTNYAVRRHRPANHGVDEHWPFADVTGDVGFLRDLLSRDVIVEREILTVKKPGIGKFDVRVHVVGGEVVHLFVRHAGSDDVVTNFSQGGGVEHTYASVLSKAQIASAVSASKAAAHVLGNRFIGIDCMFDREDPDQAIVVEAQCMCSFPKPEACNLGELIARHVMDS